MSPGTAASRDHRSFRRFARFWPTPLCAATMLWLLVASAAVVLLLSQSAVAKDRVLARDSHVARIWALDGTLVYERATGPFGQRPARRRWMRVVNGHVAPARGGP